MEKEKEKIHISKYVLKAIIEDWYEPDTNDIDGEWDAWEAEIEKYLFIEKNIDWADDEDGGGHYSVVIQRVADGKFFAVYYSDWDMELQYNFHRDCPEELIEVFPREITITIYE